MAQYKHTTLLQLRNALIKALDSDPTVVNFWTIPELTITIQEALLTFGALSGFWKKQVLINTEEAKRVYDIFTDYENLDNISPSITYGDIINWLNLDLIEHISDTTPTSKLFTLTELLNTIESKYNTFQLKTGIINGTVILNVAAQDSLVKLPDNILDIVRVKYKYEVDGTNYEVIVKRDDEESIAQNDPEALIEEGVSAYYSTVFNAPNELFLYPIPSISGILEVIYVSSRDTTNTLATSTIVNLPNNLVIYLKYAVLEDIFNKDGPLNDVGRAAYCAKRWEEGLTIGKNYTSILAAKSNGLPIATDSLSKLDNYIDDLEASSDAPYMLGLAGFNIFEIDVLPNSISNSILLSCIDNAALSVNDADFINIEIGYIDPLLNYCIHLLQFKCGVYNLALTNSYMEDFIKTSLSFNKRLMNRGINYDTLVGKTKLEETQYPKLVQQPSA